MPAEIVTRRAYEPPSPKDGYRVLVDRIWPRGVKKVDLDIADWMRHLAPSDALREWFGHEPPKWAEFKKRYFAELDALTGEGAAELATLRQHVADDPQVTLVFGAHDEKHNNAVALADYLRP